MSMPSRHIEFGCFFFSSRRRHTRWPRDWSSDVCSSDLGRGAGETDRPSVEPGRRAVSQGVTPKMVETLGRRHLMLFSGRANRPLAREVASNLGIECGSVELHDFANGEIYARFQESVRGTDAFVIQTHAEPVNERIMEQLIMIDALKRASAKRISAVVPFYGYARQDRKGR